VRTITVIAVALLLYPASAMAEDATQKAILERLERLEQNQQRLEEQLEAKDQRIEELESELGRTEETGVPPPPATPTTPVVTTPPTPPTAPATVTAAAADEEGGFGAFKFGRGFQLVKSEYGEAWFSAYTYARYLNQKALNGHYTDEFGRRFQVDQQNDIQFQKALLYFKGWVYDPNFRYLFYTWTNNANQGDGAQVVLGGNLSYRFADSLVLGAGIYALPSVRSNRGSFPFFLKVDSRTTADEFFRGSYTQGISANGTLAEGLKYNVVLGNNLSNLGVSAAELDDGLNTVSGSIWWMPTTGEYGYREGFGDFDHHDRLATTLGTQFTFSREDKQSQSSTDDPENSQIRLSDGTRIFGADAFGPGIQVDQANYYMWATDAGVKYAGFSLEGEYYLRWLGNFNTTGGDAPDSEFFDHGFQLQASTMLVPKSIQLYTTGSKIFGEYGNPWDTSLGLNWYPFKQQHVRVSGEVVYMSASPVGYTAIPLIVGGHGPAFHTNLELYF
jgi:hypothetical protein